MVNVEIEQKAEPQDVVLPNAPPEAKMRLEKFAGKGKGKSSFDLSAIAPQGDFELEIVTTMAMDLGGMKQSMETKMVSSLKYETKE